MKKADLLKLLKKGKRFEENVVPTLEEFRSKDFVWEGMSRKKSHELKKIIYKIIRDSEEHKEMLNRLLNRITWEGKDEY